MGVTDDNYSSFYWVIWCLYYSTFDNYVQYYATNVLLMKKSKINVFELTARNDHIDISEKDVMGHDNPLEPSNATVTNENKQFFKMRLETDATIKNLAILTIYNWQSTDIMDCLAFPVTSHIWNYIRHTDNNDESSTFHCHII